MLESVPIKDVADLSGVPEEQLVRVIHLTATAGFLHEPQPGQVTHSALSAPFVTNPSYLDAAMFLATSATPAALDMALTSQRFGESDRPDETAYNVALKTTQPFHTARQQCTKLHRQWSAYLHYSGGLLAAEQVTDVLTQFDLTNVRSGSSLVVEVLLCLQNSSTFGWPTDQDGRWAPLQPRRPAASRLCIRPSAF